ncbi:MAG: monofunctional biosynthetic peptidoglycan transglycosylase [Chitinispirillaceae bacterium]|jgi:monofunctional biosynthetic peptidoglycan transglycosylase
MYTTVIRKVKSLPAKILSAVWLVIKGVFILYAVVFSIAGTFALYEAYQFVVAPFCKVKALQDSNPKETAYMFRYRQTLRHRDTLEQVFVPIDSVATELQHAVIAAEDDGFYTHPGFDLEAIIAAIEYNRYQNEIKMGGSTITQQLAKNLFLTNDKKYERKYKELIYTLLMEKYLGKKRILELYLNYAQWGKTVFGCEAASRLYFKKSCKNLSQNEAALLAAVLAMPKKLSPANPNSSFIEQRVAVIATNLYMHHLIDDSGYINLTGNPPPGKDSANPADTTSEP